VKGFIDINENILFIIIMDMYCKIPFFPGASLEPAVIPTAQALISHCSTFRFMCDVPSIAVFCTE
jgi:hypothetical protein